MRWAERQMSRVSVLRSWTCWKDDLDDGVVVSGGRLDPVSLRTASVPALPPQLRSFS